MSDREHENEQKSPMDAPPSLWEYRAIFDEAERRAVEACALELDDDLVKPMVEKAAAMGRQIHRTAYDPKGNAHDRMYDDEHARVVKERAETEKTLKFARADLRETEAALARTADPGATPSPPIWLVVTAVAMMALGIAPTFKDFVFHALTDDVLAWFLSVAAGLVAGGLVASAVLLSVDAGGERSPVNVAGLAAGGLLTVGILVIRIAGAETFGEILAAIGFTLIEVAAVVFVELTGMWLRPRRRAWESRRETRTSAVAERDRAAAQVEEINHRLSDMAGAVERHRRYVEDRTVRNETVEQVEAAAVKTALDGLASGIAKNRRRLLDPRGGRR